MVSFIDGGDWVPDADYDPTTRAWFQEGMKHHNIVLGDPGIDMDTKEAVVNGIRSVNFSDGRTGVLSTDIFLKSISNAVGGYTPLGTGQSMLFAAGSIIGKRLLKRFPREIRGHEVPFHGGFLALSVCHRHTTPCRRQLRKN